MKTAAAIEKVTLLNAAGKGTNFQFRNTSTNAAGQVETKIARFDVNPADPHVQNQGPHVNLETQINGKTKSNIHQPIDPATLREGDHPMSLLKPSISCRYSEKAGFEIVGTARDLHAFAELLRNVAAGLDETVSCKLLGSEDIAPYDSAIDQIRIENHADHVSLSREHSVMHSAGDHDALRLLAENIDGLASNDAPHLHIEYYPGHFYMANGSEPLVVSLE